MFPSQLIEKIEPFPAVDMKYLSKCSSARGINVVSSTKVKIMGVKYATRETHAFTHHIVLFQPERK